MGVTTTENSSKVVDEDVVLRYLFEHKIVTASQLRRDIMSGYKLPSVRNKLLKLQNKKLVESKSLYKLGRRSGYSLTKRGLNTLGDIDFSKSRIKLKSECPLHDLTLVDLKSDLLSSENVVRYFTENLAKEEGPLVLGKPECTSLVNPDALLELRFDDEKTYTATLEFERTLKYKANYFKFFSRYYSSYEISAILFISHKDTILKSVRNYEREYLKSKKNKGKFYYSNFTKWNSEQGRVFENVDGKRFTLR